MSDESAAGWEGVIRAFLSDKRTSEEEKYLKDQLKEIADVFQKAQWFGDEQTKTLFDPKKYKKSADQSALMFQREKYAQAKTLLQQPDSLNWPEIDSDYQNEIQALDEKYTPSVWIANAVPNTGSVSFASHVAKLTHSKIDSPSLRDQVPVTKADRLTTSVLKEIVIDGAVAGNQFAPIFQFLELEYQGEKLVAELVKKNSTALAPFAESDEQLQAWNLAFEKTTIAGQLASHALLKQVYFPVAYSGDGADYHLLTAMTSSSMAQAIFDRLFDGQQESVKKQQSKGKYSACTKIVYPRRAKISVTASNHSNASQLNGRRGGKLHLLSAQPPTWKRQLSAPIRMRSWFDRGVPRYAVEEDVTHLCRFLLRYQQLEMSTRDPKRKPWLEKWAASIIDEVLFYAGAIQSLPAGWSDTPGIKLKEAQQFFLDPFREDETFQAKRDSTDWQAIVCEDFALWLNRRLVATDKKFTPQDEHRKLWAGLMENELRELDESFKVARMKQNPEVVEGSL